MHAVPVLGQFQVNLDDIQLEDLDLSEANTGAPVLCLLSSSTFSQFFPSSNCHLKMHASICDMAVLPGLALSANGAFLLTVDNLRTNVNAKFAYQRMAFPQFGGNGRVQVTAVGGHARLEIRVANDGAGRPMVNVTLGSYISSVYFFSEANLKDKFLEWHGTMMGRIPCQQRCPKRLGHEPACSLRSSMPCHCSWLLT